MTDTITITKERLDAAIKDYYERDKKSFISLYDVLVFMKEELFKPPFKITETGLYRTRDGSKVFISNTDFKEDRVYGVVEGEIDCFTWDRSGESSYHKQEDIISKWEDNQDE